jgi:hypothetical protein
MEASLTFDEPRETLHRVQGALLIDLFKAETRRLDRDLADLNSRNKAVQQRQDDGFLYNGDFWLPPGQTTASAMLNKKSSPTLHITLWGDMERWLRDQYAVKTDRDTIAQIIWMLIRDCGSDANSDVFQDIRDALPDCLVALADVFNRLQRTRPPAWTIFGNDMALRNYHRFLPKLELYAATRLFY